MRRGIGPDPPQPSGRGRMALLAGLLIGLLILVVLLWVIGTWPRPGWRGPVPQVPTAPRS